MRLSSWTSPRRDRREHFSHFDVFALGVVQGGNLENDDDLERGRRGVGPVQILGRDAVGGTQNLRPQCRQLPVGKNQSKSCRSQLPKERG